MPHNTGAKGASAKTAPKKADKTAKATPASKTKETAATAIGTAKKPRKKRPPVNGQPKTGKNPQGAGRSKILPMDDEDVKAVVAQVDEWLRYRVDGKTIAQRLGCSYDTFEVWGRNLGLWGEDNTTGCPNFTAYQAVKRAEGVDCLIEAQFRQAMGVYNPKTGTCIQAPNPIMQIFLGKNYGGQSDKIDHTTGGDKLQPAAAVTLNIVRRPRKA